MRILLFLLTMLFWVPGFSVLMDAKNSIHEIGGMLLILIGMVSLSGMAICHTIIETNKS